MPRVRQLAAGPAGGKGRTRFLNPDCGQDTGQDAAHRPGTPPQATQGHKPSGQGWTPGPGHHGHRQDSCARTQTGTPADHGRDTGATAGTPPGQKPGHQRGHVAMTGILPGHKSGHGLRPGQPPRNHREREKGGRRNRTRVRRKPRPPRIPRAACHERHARHQHGTRLLAMKGPLPQPPISGRRCPHLGRLSPNSLALARSRPNLGRVWQILGRISQSRQTIAWSRQHWRNSASIGPTPAVFHQKWPG